jgi:XapX domain-containing protein
MRALFVSFAIGLGVGVLYGLLRVKSPAPPVVALLGLLGMVIGEQVGTWLHTTKLDVSQPAKDAEILTILARHGAAMGFDGQRESDDAVDEALEETFPASDPPANTVVTGARVEVESRPAAEFVVRDHRVSQPGDVRLTHAV